MNRTIERAYDMLNIVARSKDGLSLVDIINEMDIPKNSALIFTSFAGYSANQDTKSISK